MLGGAVSLARQFAAQQWQPDLILASDMLDLTTFLALARLWQTPSAVYFHENQLSYPLNPRQKPDKERAFINYTSALAADVVFFNSRFHLDSFFTELPRLLKHYPDHNELATLPELHAKSHVLPVGVDLRRLDAHRTPRDPHAAPLILWNHRWEPDKNPALFVAALRRLVADGVDFRVAILGENIHHQPTIFDAVRAELGERVVQFGYVAGFAEYARLLWSADVVVSTAKHEFFGISVVEALYCGCAALLPKRLSYPELIPVDLWGGVLYRHDRDFYPALRAILSQRPPSALATHVARYDWGRLAPLYDALFLALASRQPLPLL